MNLKHEIEKITDGYGCDVYFEVTGNPISVQQGKAVEGLGTI